MSLIECPECGKEISSKAIKCPECGFPIKSEKSIVSNRDIEVEFKDGKSVSLKNDMITVFDEFGNVMCSDFSQNYTLRFYGFQTPVVGNIYLEIIFTHPNISNAISIKSEQGESSFEDLKYICKYMKNHSSIDIIENPKNIARNNNENFRWKNGRLAIGIISIISFVLISFQSCAAGLSNAIENNGSQTGSLGLMLAFCMLISGIVGICTRNSKSRIGFIISIFLYWFGALLTVGTGDTYGDLPIWGIISFAFGLVFIISIIKNK